MAAGGAGMTVMRIAGMGDLLTAEDDMGHRIGGKCGGRNSSVHAVAVAEMDSYVIEVSSSDMAEVLQVCYSYYALYPSGLSLRTISSS